MTPTPLMTTARSLGMSRALTAQPSLPLFGRTAESQASLFCRRFCRLCHWHQQPGPSGGKHLQLHGWSHGFISQDGVVTDLNTRIPGDSNLFIIAGSNINERGQISGMTTVMSGPDEGTIHAILLTPVEGRIDVSMSDVARTRPGSNLPSNARSHHLPRFGLGQLQR